MNILKNLKRYYIISLILISLIILYRHIGQYGFKLNTINLILSYSFIVICTSYIFLFLKLNEDNKQFPLFPLILIYFLITYGFSFELLNFYLNTHNQNIITKAYIVMNLGISFFGIGYFLSKKFFYRKKELELLTFNNFNIILFFGLILISFNIINKLYPFVPNSLNQIFQPMISIGCGIIFYYIIYSNKFYRFFYLIPVLIIIFLEILNSSFVYPATIILQYFLIFFIFKKKLPIFQIILFFFIFIFLHTFKSDFREYLSQSKTLETLDRTEIFFDIYKLSALKDLKNNVTKGDKSKENLWRVSHSFSSLLIIVEKSPEEIPYYKGETYKILLTKIVPRILWKNKPSDEYANSTGRKYDVLGQEDYSTSWNLPILNEAFANFGYLGVLIVMFVLGILVRILINLFSINNFNSFESFIGIYICSKTFFWEPHLSLVFGGLHFVIIFLYIITILFSVTVKNIIK